MKQETKKFNPLKAFKGGKEEIQTEKYPNEAVVFLTEKEGDKVTTKFVNFSKEALKALDITDSNNQIAMRYGKLNEEGDTGLFLYRINKEDAENLTYVNKHLRSVKLNTLTVNTNTQRGQGVDYYNAIQEIDEHNSAFKLEEPYSFDNTTLWLITPYEVEEGRKENEDYTPEPREEESNIDITEDFSSIGSQVEVNLTK